MIKASKIANYHYIILDSCEATILKHLLHPDGKYVWLRQHMPDPFLGWWNCDIPLSPGDIIPDARIRNLSYDLEVSLEFFLSNIDRFVPHGLNLTQLTKPVPNGLWPPSLPEDKVQRILLQNGMLTQFELPHKCELAQFSCSDLEHLLRVVEIPEVKSLLLE